jgi:serine/threonine-protein kinase HipA
MIFSGSTERDQVAFRARERRGQLRKLYRNLYTDDLDRPADEIVRESVLAIAAVLLPDWQLSHSSAAIRGPVDGHLFMSGAKTGGHVDLPGVRIIRLKGLSAPEHDAVPTPTQAVRGVDRPAEVPSLKVSTPLQTVFECLSTARHYPEKGLPDTTIASMIERLPSSDRERAERFAARNGLRREYLRYRGLSFEAAAAQRAALAEPDGAEISFYGWRIGKLTYLGGGEYRFQYDPDWPTALSAELPITDQEISYEGRRMPAFFENCLPEGWTESVVLASNKLSREDLFGLFSTTRKYLSNLTLRPLGIPETELVYDAHTIRVGQLARDAAGVVHLQEQIGGEPADLTLWRKTRTDGLLRLSGVQAKLPVSLTDEAEGVTARLGDLRHACTHILKVPAREYPGLIVNEWATMELARRVGLRVASVARIRFQEESEYQGVSLLVERYDIPDRETLQKSTSQASLYLQEDACSLLLLRREDKYDASMEKIADALLEAGVPLGGPEGMLGFFQLVLYSWIIGNGDLHAKNVSILRRFRTGRPGEPPVVDGIELAPFYDLVNTRLHLRRDEFALPVDGRRDNLHLRNFERLCARWDMTREEVRAEVEAVVDMTCSTLDDVLGESGLSADLQAQYRDIVRENVSTLGL